MVKSFKSLILMQDYLKYARQMWHIEPGSIADIKPGSIPYMEPIGSICHIKPGSIP